jgi:phosphopantetheinyl transferase
LEVAHFANGRPHLVLDRKSVPYDLSISHKNDFIGVGIVADPYKIGIDIEVAEQSFNDNFATFFLTTDEIKILRTRSDVILFWSLKESFYKALGLFLSFKQLQIRSVGSEIHLTYSKEVQNIMQAQKLSLVSTNYFVDTGFMISYTVFNRVEF